MDALAHRRYYHTCALGDSLLSLWLFTIFFSTLDAAFPVTWATSGDFFGRKHFATIRGNMTFCLYVGQRAGPVIAGYFYDQTRELRRDSLGIVATLSAIGVADIAVDQTVDLKWVN